MSKKTENTVEYVDYTPAADIIDTDNAVKLYLDMPGAGKNTLEINIDDHVLNIVADTGILYGGKNLRYNRSFSVSDEINQGRISAKINDGVLEMVLPKSDTAKTMKIPVTS